MADLVFEACMDKDGNLLLPSRPISLPTAVASEGRYALALPFAASRNDIRGRPDGLRSWLPNKTPNSAQSRPQSCHHSMAN
ncbi:hypothetical protein [Aromatoleum petrolei]|uniref:Uncharacterized protein n=1 Tax=Aromatoleum petrolei TaxID=76116 RepID=A0ABX1MKP8_9RHOO|nr:hypothetical protein [Aromatoleum petrolei]NMF88550.1 hypothetical protein [Aromatoleum petrolei]QTQ34742.1 Uncharacterized protein ToN1_05690 [Aromatoleum petrolei]